MRKNSVLRDAYRFFTSLFKSLGEHLIVFLIYAIAINHGEFFVSALEDFKTLIKEGVVWREYNRI